MHESRLIAKLEIKKPFSAPALQRSEGLLNIQIQFG